MNDDIDAAIMITASHNPKDWNGIKFCDDEGLAYNYENLYGILENQIDEIEVPDIELDHKLIRDGALFSSQYFAYLESKFVFETKLKVLIEYGNGSVGQFDEVLEKLNCDVDSLHNSPDGNFPAMIPDPTKEKTFNCIKKHLQDKKYDITIAFDGDGDRVGFMTPKGKLISPDHMVMLFSEDIFKKNNKVSTLMDVKMSLASIEYIESFGGEVNLTQTGHSWVHKRLIELKADIAAELSCHYYFEDDYLGFDDGLYSALRFLKILDQLKTKNEGIDDILDKLPKYYSSPEFRDSISTERQNKIIEALKNYTLHQNGKLITIDGIRGEFDNGWFLARKSGTEEALSYRIEGKTELDFENLKNEVLSIINDN
jgi:phosphomannomutase/phosphoglucomutase